MTLSWTNQDNDVTDSCLVGYSGWIALTLRTQFVSCPPTSAQPTTRDEISIKRLLRFLVGNLVCNMIVGCNLDVPGTAGTPQGSVVVMTDADWAGHVKIVAATLELQFGSRVLSKTRGIPSMRPPRSRLWFV